MGTLAARLSRVPYAGALARPPAATIAGLTVLTAVSALLRTRRLGVGYWIDEGLSIGIADRPLADIPGVLRQDGSPPLYYIVLHGWLRLLGDHGEHATHALSLLFALAAIPVAWLLVRSLFGARAAWVVALLAATNPFLTAYAQETRMYSLAVLLGFAACAAFAGAFAFERGRRWTLAFGALLAALLYTHNWSLFFGAACGAAWLALAASRAGRERGRLLREGVIGFGLAGAAYLPWVPSLLYQARHTGAPWARRPSLEALVSVPERLLGPSAVGVVVLAAGAGIVLLLRARAEEGGDRREGASRSVGALIAIAVGTPLLAWLASQANPAWAIRYLAIAVAPWTLLAGLGLARAGRLGVAGLGLVVLVWAGASAPAQKSNVREIVRQIDPGLAPGDLVISTQPEQVPVLAHYLETPGLVLATLTGGLRDVGVTDWRDGVERLRATRPERHLAPLLDRVAPGRRVVLVEPEVTDLRRWSAPWTSLVRIRSQDWSNWMHDDPRFRVVAVRPMLPAPGSPNPVKATILLRSRIR